MSRTPRSWRVRGRYRSWRSCDGGDDGVGGAGGVNDDGGYTTDCPADCCRSRRRGASVFWRRAVRLVMATASRGVPVRWSLPATNNRRMLLRNHRRLADGGSKVPRDDRLSTSGPPARRSSRRSYRRHLILRLHLRAVSRHLHPPPTRWCPPPPRHPPLFPHRPRPPIASLVATSSLRTSLVCNTIATRAQLSSFISDFSFSS